MILRLLPFSILLFCIIACSSPQISKNENTLSHELKSELNAIAILMDSGEFATSERRILLAFERHGDSLSNIEKYYLSAFEAEVMYYSALFDQGMNSALKSRSLGDLLNDSVLIGSSENFLGLFYMNKHFPDSALRHFNNALKMLPPNDTTLWISRRFHVLNNIGELYLELEEPDSAIAYTRKAMEILAFRKIKRATSLGFWNIGEALIIKGESDSAYIYLDSGFAISNANAIDDVSLFLLSSKIKLAATLKDKVQLYKYLQDGTNLYNLPQINSYAKTQFLRTSIEALRKINDLSKSLDLQTKLLQIEKEIKSTEENLKIEVLNKYYENEQNLLIVKEEKEKQALEIKQNKILTVTLGALLIFAVAVVLLVRRNSIQKEKLQKIAFEIEKDVFKQEQEKKEYKALLDAIEEERNRIAKELHDDIGSSMSSISIYSNVALESFHNNPDKAKELLARIKNQTTQIAENLSDLIWAIYSKNDTYGHLIQRMKNFSFEILSAKNIQTNFHFDYQFQAQVAGLDIRKNVLLFFKEAINNIAKYSNATDVSVSLTEHNNLLTLIIKDNGIGFDQETVIEGNGLASLRARSKAINGNFKIESKTGQGTSLELSFTDKMKEATFEKY
jgi:two-component system, NarL family, sensor histidine kinase UhpB